MGGKVILTVKRGPDKGRVLCIEKSMLLTIGRDDSCSFQVPISDETSAVGRLHCQMQIDPPKVMVRDFGSLNGTYLNDKKIKRRRTGIFKKNTGDHDHRDFEMKDGDVLSLGLEYKIELKAYISEYCADCSVELSQDKTERVRTALGHNICRTCSERQQKNTTQMFTPSQDKRQCKICNNNLPDDLDHDDNICRVCKAHTSILVEHFFEDVKKSETSATEMITGYRKVERIAEGGMGELWLVENEKNGKLSVVKLLFPQNVVDKHAKKYFLRELHIVTKLKHPNVVNHFERGYFDGIYYILMEYCELKSVDKFVEKFPGKIMPRRLIKSIILQALDGLIYVHNAVIPTRIDDNSVRDSHGLVHRDFTPHNIFLCGDPETPTVKLADFGIGKAYEFAGMTGNTTTGTVVGKPFFMSRQQIQDYKYCRPEVDVWSAAATLYNMLTGTYPKDFPKGQDQFYSALNNPSVPIRERETGLHVDAKLATLLDKALDDRKELYFKTALNLKNELIKVL